MLHTKMSEREYDFINIFKCAFSSKNAVNITNFEFVSTVA